MITVKLVVLRGQPPSEASTFEASAGTVIPVRLDEWAAGATGFMIQLPESLVIVPPELVDAVRDADAAEFAALHKSGTSAEPWLQCCIATCDARLALADAILEQLKP